MSVVKSIKPNWIVNNLGCLVEILQRSFVNPELKIFYPYKCTLKHPVFKAMINNPPLDYVNIGRAQLLHLIHGATKKLSSRDYVIETIDHVLSPLAAYFGKSFTPQGYVDRIDIVKEIYASANCKKIILISEGQRKIFNRYIEEQEIMNKTVIIPLATYENMPASLKCIDRKKPINFLCIASNYEFKGVEFILRAWEEFSLNTKSTLTLVCHDLPEKEKTRVLLNKSIRLIDELPLKPKTKMELYNNAHVCVVPMLTDGTGVFLEALSNGLPIITYRAQHSFDFTGNQNGIVIDSPINVYDEGFGVEWKTYDGFLDRVNTLKKEGAFDQTVKGLVDAFTLYDTDHDELKHQSEATCELYHKEHSIEVRNDRLLQLYNNVFEEMGIL